MTHFHNMFEIRNFRNGEINDCQYIGRGLATDYSIKNNVRVLLMKDHNPFSSNLTQTDVQFMTLHIGL